ncbi:MAG: alpha/beta hydrolase [Bacteriovoracaceae bacterium]
MSKKRVKVESFLYADYETLGPENSENLYLLLHGFGESGHKMLKRLKAYLPPDSLLLAPNGIYPLPQKTEEGYNLGYAWYFYDSIKKIYYIDYELPASFLEGLIKTLGWDNKKLTIIGYSQGGYLAPFAGLKMPQCEHVITVNANYKYDMFCPPISFRFDGLNGMKDEMVDPYMAKESYKKLQESGVSGCFYDFPDEGHRFSKAFLEKIKQLTQ